MNGSNSDGNSPDLPEGWDCRALGDVAEVIRGVTYKKDQVGVPEAAGHIPLLRATNIAEPGLVLQDFVWIPQDLVKEPQMLREGDLVVAASSGSLSVVGKAAQVDDQFEGTFGAFCAVVRPDSSLVDPCFLRWFMASDGYRRRVSSLAAGSNINNLKRVHLLEMRVPLPSLEEQGRIAQRISELSADIAAGRRSASRAHAHGTNLLRAAAEEEVHRLDREGCQQASAEDLSTDVPYALAIGPFGSNLKVSDYSDSGIPLVFVRNIRAEEFGGTSAKFVSHEKAAELRAHRVQAGDLLVTKMGNPPGDCAVYPLSAPDAIITSDCIRFAVDRARARPDYVAALFLTAKVKRQIRERTKGVAQKKVSLMTFKTIQFPLPDLKRQDAIVARLNDVREAQGALDQTLRDAAAQGSRLERSVVRAAFLGML